jgi:hypothetical protein
MEKPTIWSSRPDSMNRTVRIDDALSRRAQYGRIRPMVEERPLRSLILRFISLN